MDQLQEVADAQIAPQDERVIAKYLSTPSKHSGSDDEALKSSSESSDLEYMPSYRTPHKAEYRGKGLSPEASEEDELEFPRSAHGLSQPALSSSSSSKSQGLYQPMVGKRPSDLGSNVGEDLPTIQQSVHSHSNKSSSSSSQSSPERSKSPKSHTNPRDLVASTHNQPYDPSMALSRDPSKLLSKNPSKALSKNPSRILSRDASQNPLKCLSRDPSQVLSKDSSKILSKDSSKASYREEVKAAIEIKPDPSRRTLDEVPRVLQHSAYKTDTDSSKISQASSVNSGPLAIVPSASSQALPVHPEESKDNLQSHFAGSLSKQSLELAEGHSKESSRSSKSSKSKSKDSSSKSSLIESRDFPNDSSEDMEQHSPTGLRDSKHQGNPKDSSSSESSKRSHHSKAEALLDEEAAVCPDEEAKADDAATFIENGLQLSQTKQHNEEGLEAVSRSSLRSLHKSDSGAQSSKRSLAPSALEDFGPSGLSQSDHNMSDQPLQHKPSDRSLSLRKAEKSDSSQSSHRNSEADKSPLSSRRKSPQEDHFRKLLSAQSSNLGEVSAEVSALRDEVIQALVEEVKRNAGTHRSSKQSIQPHSRKSSSNSSKSSKSSHSSPSSHKSSKSSSKSSSSSHSRAELLPDGNEQKSEVSYTEEYPAIHEQADAAMSVPLVTGGLPESSDTPTAVPNALLEALQDRILGELEEAKEVMNTELDASSDSSKSGIQAQARTSSSGRVQAPLPDFVHVIRLETVTEQNLNEPVQVKSSEQYALLDELASPKVGTDELAAHDQPVLRKSSSSSSDSSKSQVEEANENSGLEVEPTPELSDANPTSLPSQDERTISASSSDSDEDEEAILRKIMKYERQVKQLQDESLRQALNSDDEANTSLIDVQSPSPWREQTLQPELNEEYKHDLKEPPLLAHSLSRHKSSHSGGSSSSSNKSSKKASSSSSSSSYSAQQEGDEL
jgi:hypothetical protein